MGAFSSKASRQQTLGLGTHRVAASLPHIKTWQVHRAAGRPRTALWLTDGLDLMAMQGGARANGVMMRLETAGDDGGKAAAAPPPPLPHWSSGSANVYGRICCIVLRKTSPRIAINALTVSRIGCRASGNSRRAAAGGVPPARLPARRHTLLLPEGLVQTSGRLELWLTGDSDNSGLPGATGLPC